MITLDYEFSSTLWEYSIEKTSWFFVTLPEDISADIKTFTKNDRPGYKTVRVSVSVGETNWLTSLFPDKASGCYFLPIKKSVRKSEGLSKDDNVTVKLEVFI